MLSKLNTDTGTQMQVFTKSNLTQFLTKLCIQEALECEIKHCFKQHSMFDGD